MPYKVMASGCITNDCVCSLVCLFNCVDWLISTLCVKNEYICMPCVWPLVDKEVNFRSCLLVHINVVITMWKGYNLKIVPLIFSSLGDDAL